MAKSRFNYDEDEVEEILTDVEDGTLKEEAEIEARLKELLAKEEAAAKEAQAKKEAEAAAEQAALEAQAKELEAKIAQEKFIQDRDSKNLKNRENRVLVSQLRKLDPPTRKTCAKCLTRVPLNFIGYGNHDVCDSCK